MSDNRRSALSAAVERHPLEPFLPPDARLLMLGSFPPPRRRWSMEFFYPNLQNDMWRIVGYLAAGDKSHFLLPGGRAFDRERIAAFCRQKGIALYDTAIEVIRLKNNASDDSLQVLHEVDLEALLARIPHCRDIVATGGKAAETLHAIVAKAIAATEHSASTTEPSATNALANSATPPASLGAPPVGGCVEFVLSGRNMRLWRMPSSSRAYPRPVEWKAEFYRRLFQQCGML